MLEFIMGVVGTLWHESGWFGELLIVGILVEGGRVAHAAWRARKVPLFNAADLPAETYGQVVGEVVCEEPMWSPMSCRSCVYYRIEIWGQSPNGHPIPKESQEDAVTFRVEDASGQVEVRGLTAAFETNGFFTSTARIHSLGVHPDLVDFLASRDVELPAWGYITETIVPVEVQVTVFGLAMEQTLDSGRPVTTLESNWVENQPLQVACRRPSFFEWCKVRLRHLWMHYA